MMTQELNCFSDSIHFMEKQRKNMIYKAKQIYKKVELRLVKERIKRFIVKERLKNAYAAMLSSAFIPF